MSVRVRPRAVSMSAATTLTAAPLPSLGLAVARVEEGVDDALGHLDGLPGGGLELLRLRLVDLRDHVGVGVLDDPLDHLLAGGQRVLCLRGQILGGEIGGRGALGGVLLSHGQTPDQAALVNLTKLAASLTSQPYSASARIAT